jgi:hypothetical protein
MSTTLMQIFYQSELNKVIQKKILAHHPSIGALENDQPLPDYIVANMNEVSKEIVRVVQELNSIFIEKNITANSSDAYIKFMCDLVSEYLLVPSFNDIGSLSKEEIEAIVISQVETTSVSYMRAALAENAYANQSVEAVLTKEQIVKQFKEIEDGTIKDAYKTLLMKQINKSNLTIGELNG